MVLWPRVVLLVLLGCWWCCEPVGGILPGHNPHQNQPPPAMQTATDICREPGCSCGTYSAVFCDLTNIKKELIIRKNYMPQTTSKIELRNCYKVTVTAEAIKDLTALRSITMSNITLLELQENGLSWGLTEYQDNYSSPGINITIENATLSVLPSYAFTGQINGLTIRNTKIGAIRAYAFSKLAGSEKILLENCEIQSVDPFGFKKFIVDYFIVTGGSIGKLPSYSVNDITVRKNLRLEEIKIQEIKSQAFRVSQPTNFRLDNCVIDSMDAEAFRTTTNGPVFITNNIFNKLGSNAFTGISVDARFQSLTGKQEFVFDNNTLTDFSDGALTFNTSGFKPTVDRIVIRRQCSCVDAGTWMGRLVRYTTPPPPSGVGKLIWCQKGQHDSVVDAFYGKHCKPTSSMVFIIVGVVLVALIIVVVICFVTYILCRRRILKRYVNVPTDGNCNRHSTCSGGSNHIMVVPDGKTYRETELHVIVERAEPITEFKPEPAYELINERANTKD